MGRPLRRAPLSDPDKPMIIVVRPWMIVMGAGRRTNDAKPATDKRKEERPRKTTRKTTRERARKMVRQKKFQ